MLLFIEVFLDGVLKSSSCFILKKLISKQRVREEDLRQKAVNNGGRKNVIIFLFIRLC